LKSTIIAVADDCDYEIRWLITFNFLKQMWRLVRNLTEQTFMRIEKVRFVRTALFCYAMKKCLMASIFFMFCGVKFGYFL
jgi:hypothetical protein